MEIYLVGGAVRDMLLGITPKDKDYVVVGATEKQMLDRGFIKISASFPIFIDPETRDEYALARAEKKTGSGYHGFTTDFSTNITLEDDLRRRDLTINSIAMDSNNNLIDPFSGHSDLKNRVLRHTSNAFVEDPLRVIRLARFKAQFCDFDFSIADDTKDLVSRIIKSGELNHLKKERLNIEFIKALKNPKIFFETLDTLNALKITFPTLKKVLQNIPNISFFNHQLYQQISTDERIALALININMSNLPFIRSELSLTNKQYKLLKAVVTINTIMQNNFNPPETLKSLKSSNILRDLTLQLQSIQTYLIFIKINSDERVIKFNALKKMITELSNLDIQSLLTKTSQTELQQAIHKLQLETIKKHLKYDTIVENYF